MISPISKQVVHPSGLEITFDQTAHVYTDTTGRRYISATQFIGQFFPKFDTAAVAAKVAAERKVNQAKLIAEWNAETERGRREGTHIHDYAEALICGRDDWHAPENVREARLYRQVTRAVVALLKRFDFMAAEQIIFSPTLGIAGMIDLIMADRETGEAVLFDWKQNKEIGRDNVWQKALPPIEHLDDCDMNKYSLQLGLYYRIVRQERYYLAPRFRAALIHLREDFYKVIPLRDSMNKEIDAMLEAV